MNDALTAIAAKHHPCRNEHSPQHCLECDEQWPCLTSNLLHELADWRSRFPLSIDCSCGKSLQIMGMLTPRLVPCLDGPNPESVMYNDFNAERWEREMFHKLRENFATSPSPASPGSAGT